MLEVSRRNPGIDEKKDSPSKTAKIVMRYISSLTDVGMQRSNQQIPYSTLVEMGQTFDKVKAEWTSSDLRLIFACETSAETNTVIAQF